jgi:hypothetical protein
LNGCFKKKPFPDVGLVLPGGLRLFTILGLRTHRFLSTGDQKYILKYIHSVNFEDLEDVNNKLRGRASHVRLPQDTIPKKSMFVFEYLADHFLRLVQKDLPLETTKRILKDALLGIAELHDQDIVHTGT